VNKSIQLQSLRGIAVALVVLFHMGFLPFRNGWIGVDIFFVISGFLMWELYRRPILSGNSADFYIRRLKRLLPALSVLLIFSNFVFFLRFLPHERNLLIKETFTANIFASNLNYWMGDQYFSNGSLRPLLNLWSIALEIQFYLLFPLVVRFIKNSKFRFALLFTFSFATFLFLSIASPQTNFFLLPGRLWEFLVGVLVGAAIRVKLNCRPNFMLVLLLSLIFLAFTLGLSLDRTQTVVFQIVSVTVFGFLIWASWVATGRNFLLICLSKLGDYSYSIYLIHFPLIVLISYRPFQGNPSGVYGNRNLFLFSSLLILLSWISKQKIEDSELLRQNFKSLWCVSLVCSLLLFLLQPLVLNLGFNGKEQAISNASRDRGDFRCGLLLRLPLFSDSSKTCLLEQSPEGLEKVLLVGNSHADAIKEAVVRALPNKSVYLLNENNPLRSLNLKVYKSAISKLRPSIIILHSSAGSTSLEALEDLLRFTSSQNIKFVIINPVPTPGFDVPSKVYDLLGSNKPITDFADPGYTLEAYNSINRVEIDGFSRLASTWGILQVSVAELFCKPYCQIVDSQSLKPLYFDSGHLTITGASRLVLLINAVIK
jgi:peptidoglycan/LPS O-acetylase OafA/YrhL